ncbi:hypothetical protein AVEN_78009-1 [Araneus ventricosus]|uniref:Uncharacterized protein n=1 Tax=Araneus ventricosus TaxID=182803 RepID=A0A4Y2DMI3_ARAVE|nr:hypothetical protein AVEN_78009-1 [Araneus ventricosus]
MPKKLITTFAYRVPSVSTGHSDPLQHLLLPSPSKREPTPCSNFLWSERASPRIYTGRISALMTRSKYIAWIFRLVGNPKFPPHRSNSNPIFTSVAGFGVDRSARESCVPNKRKSP